MLHLTGSPEVFPDGFAPRQFPADKAKHPGMMQPHHPVVLRVQVHGIVFRQAEIRIIQVRYQFRGRLNPLCPVQHQQALKAVRQQHLLLQRLIQPSFLSPDHHQGQRSAIQPGPAQGIGQLLLHAVPGFQPAQDVDLFRIHGGGKPVPGAGHIFRRRINNPLRQPGFPVHGRQKFRIRCQSGSEKRPGRKQRRILSQKRRRVGITVCAANTAIFQFTIHNS